MPDTAPDQHRSFQELLPWYVTGVLDARDRDELEAHLAVCGRCAAELEAEGRLRQAVATLPLAGVAPGATTPVLPRNDWRSVPPPASRGVRRVLARPGWKGWVIAAQAATLVAVLLSPRTDMGREPAYHTLGDATGPATPNIVIIFLPTTTERDLRAALGSVGARLVDGPTATNGYLLRVPSAGRAAALTSLRARADVVLAEPIDRAPTL